jgi:hypothetical protein
MLRSSRRLVWRARPPLAMLALALAPSCTGATPSDESGGADTQQAGFSWNVLGSGEIEHTFTEDESVQCHDVADLHTALASSQAELDALLGGELVGAEAPAVDFAADVVVAAWLVQCSSTGRQLVTDDVRVDGGDLVMSLTASFWSEMGVDVLTRPYTFVAVSAGAYDAVVPDLTVVANWGS